MIKIILAEDILCKLALIENYRTVNSFEQKVFNTNYTSFIVELHFYETCFSKIVDSHFLDLALDNQVSKNFMAQLG